MPYEDDVFEILKTERPSFNMPNIQRLMKNGMSFYRCVTPSPLCAPARACLASGLRYESCRVPCNSYDYPVDQPSFYHMLKSAGYTVGGVGKFDLHKKALFWGLNGWVDDLGKIGFTVAVDSEGKWDGVAVSAREPKGPYFKYLYDNGLAEEYLADMYARKKGGSYYTEPTTLPEDAYGDTWVGTNGVKMLKSFPSGRPWFLQVNFPGPHDPWDITKEMKKRWETVSFPKANRGLKERERDINAVRQNYAAMLENIDDQAGRLIEEINKRGELENTIIVYSSDHGEMLGDLGLFHKNVPNRGSVNVPLVLWGAGISQGKSSGALAELNDLSATFLDYAGITNRFNDSVSLRPVLSGKAEAHRESVQSALGSWRAVYDCQYKSVFIDGALMERYDFVNDPWERINLIETKKDEGNDLFENSHI